MTAAERVRQGERLLSRQYEAWERFVLVDRLDLTDPRQSVPGQVGHTFAWPWEAPEAVEARVLVALGCESSLGQEDHGFRPMGSTPEDLEDDREALTEAWAACIVARRRGVSAQAQQAGAR